MLYKNVVFEKIRLQNFLSYGETPTEIEFKNGITFITGYNKDDDDTNGVGKTSLIVESLSFLIFGDSYKGLPKNLIKNSHTKGTCVVEGWLKVNDDSIHITRSISPNRLILEVNGDSTNYTKTIPETTKDIIKILGINKSTFVNTIVMTNKDSLSFLNQTKAEKNKFIEDILGLGAFADFFKKSKEELKEVDKKLDMVDYKKTFIKKTLDNDILEESRFESNKQTKLQNLNINLEELYKVKPVDNSEKIKELHQSYKDMQEEITVKRNKLAEATTLLHNNEYKLNDLGKKLKDFDKTTTCPTCKRPFDTHSQDNIILEKDKLAQDMAKIQTIVDKLKPAVTSSRQTISSYEKNLSEIASQISRLEKDQKVSDELSIKAELISKEMDMVRESKNLFTGKIERSNQELQTLLEESAALSLESKVLDAVKNLASPDGIKAVLTNRVIDVLNDRINYYLIKLGSPFILTFDQYFDEKIVHKNGIEYSYNSLSGGEAKRVDFAMLFAFRDMRKFQSNININLTVMDELFDSALSEKGMFSIVELLKDIDSSCFYIVTHRPTNVDDNGCNVIRLIKENGITRVDTSL